MITLNFSASCCKAMVTAMALIIAGNLQKNPAKELHDLNNMKKECCEWITTCSQLLSGIKGRKIKLLTDEEEDYLTEEEEILKEFMQAKIDMPFKEDKEESTEKFEKKEEKEEPSTSTEDEKLVRFIGEDENVHSKPLSGADKLSSWRDPANQGTLASKYREAISIIEHMQDKLIEVENRASKAEKKFDDANEKLHFTLIKNKELEKELEEIQKSRKKELEEEENEGERAEEDKEDDFYNLLKRSKPSQKGTRPKESTLSASKSKTRTKSSRGKPKHP